MTRTISSSTLRRHPAVGAALLALATITAPAFAQSLFIDRSTQPAPQGGGGTGPGTGPGTGTPASPATDEARDTWTPIRTSSLYFVEPPKPKTFSLHDQVTIIIDESSKQESTQTLDTKKDYDFAATLRQFPSVKALFDGVLETGNSNPVANMGVGSKNKFKGDGTYERNDKFSARITAKVIDVKPNGLLVLEARKAINKDEETQTIVLSGSCRREDVTDANTVLSSQLADLIVTSKQEGQVKDTATKGLIPRVFEALFNF